jgi:hypothetical protein
MMLVQHLLLVAALRIPSSVDSVLKTYHEDGSQETFETATFVYYGPQRPHVGGMRMLWVEPNDVCNVKLDEVRGKFVVTTRIWNGGYGCDLGEVYTRLGNYGAAGLAVQTFTVTPGFCAFAKSDWEGRPNGKMPFVDIETGFDAKAFSGLVVDIEEPHNLAWESMFSSWLWTLVMRVALPLTAFLAFLLSAHIVFTRWHARVPRSRSRPLGFTIGINVMVASLAVSVMFVVGLYGPMLTPLRFNLAFYLLTSGSSVFITVLLSLLAREKTRALNNLAERDVWEHYRGIVTLSAIIFLGCDVANFFFFVFNLNSSTNFSLAIFGMAILFILLGQVFVGSYFFYQVRFLL